jgi:hypothetical protein
MSRIRVHINRLVLPEMDSRDREALIEGLRAELARALSDTATRAAWARPHRTPVLRLGRMALEPGRAAGKKFGSALGRSIGKGLKP